MSGPEQKKRGFFSRFFGLSRAGEGETEAKPEMEARHDDTAAAEPSASAPPDDTQCGETQPVDRPADAGRATAAQAEPPVAPDDAAAPSPEAAAVPAQAARKSWLQRLKDGLFKTSSSLSNGIASLFNKRKLDAATLEELEDILIQADFGVEAAARIAQGLGAGRFDRQIAPDEVRALLAAEIEKTLEPYARPLELKDDRRPHVILVVGVNGTGKTTTIGKLAKDLSEGGKRVTLAAGDTFRAAAIEQLKIWGERTGSPVVARAPGSDAAGLAYDAMVAARDHGADVLIIDTAGRLQNKTVLMAELEKIVRVIRKADPSAPHDVLLTLDATTGQNALAQVEAFRKAAGVTGLVMTKLDGTARGGILVAIASKYGLPVHAIGVGEGIDDLHPFNARDFARAITGA